MTSVQLQFHATPADLPEICDLIRSASSEVRMYAWGKNTGLISVRDKCVDLPSEVVQLIAVLGVIRGGAESALDVFDRNPGALVISVPKIENGELREIDLSAKADGEVGVTQIALWRKVIRRLKTSLISGANVTNPRTGASQHYKNAYATPRAIEAATSGVLLTAPGGNRFDYGPSVSK